MKPMRHTLHTLAMAAVVVIAASATGTGRSAAAAKNLRAPAHPMVLPFIADDYTRAVAEARAHKVPLFIEAWAPW
jgi:hypothetical protein